MGRHACGHPSPVRDFLLMLLIIIIDPQLEVATGIREETLTGTITVFTCVV